MRKPRSQGFTRAGQFMQSRIRQGSEGRGFTNARLLTHWVEVVGQDLAAITRPVQVKYQKGGMGAVLEVLTNGANAPVVDMRKAEILRAVNATYGYNAIARVQITQTAPTGFSEGRVDFTHKPKEETSKTHPIAPDAAKTAQNLADGVQNDALKTALESLGQKVLTKS